MRSKGKITSWNDEKGFGFITPSSGGNRIFVHIKAFSKSAARKGAWRTQESTLHLLSLVGGWPGALVAQQKLRHKSKKQSFRFVFCGGILGRTKLAG